MTLSLPTLTLVKPYLPGIYFIAVSTWIGFDNQNLWMTLIVLPFIVQIIISNKYLNLILGFLMILWSAYMALAFFFEVEKTLQFVSLGLCFTIANLYMSRMLFLNQNFKIAAFRENSLDETLFI
ncbi:MAG: hypothetical protein H7Y07_07100 [Pyrinomonadaceae bacterium]|nr:hypothetical protein [Sphingobacteriaceae bacterium]